MARGIPFGADRNVLFPMYRGERFRLWSYFSVEVAPDLIVTPMLFGTHPQRADARASDVCTLPPYGLVVLHARGEEHVRAFYEELAPRLRRLPFPFIYDADRRRLYDVRCADLWMEASQLPAIVRAVVAGYDGEHIERCPAVLDSVVMGVQRALAEMPTSEEVATFRALPEVEARVAEAARRFEESPLRLWEAMLWRGENYRWELVNGEVPLVGELWSALAANRTLMRCVADAERAFEARASEDPVWICCGPFRMRQRGTRVEIRLRMSPADRRAAFLPTSQVEGEDAMPSLFGVLTAGGGKGKTEMTHGYIDSVVKVHESHQPRDVAEHLANEIRRITGAKATVRGSARYWPESEGEDWRVYWWNRYVYVYMPGSRANFAPWDAHSGLHLSDDFVFYRWHQEQRSTP